VTTTRACAERLELPSPVRYGLWLLIIVQTSIIGGCVIQPQWQRLAHGQGLEIDWLDSSEFRHLVIDNSLPGTHLKIYIEGDGLPWIREQRISIDPTPSDPLLLRLMIADDAAAIYLGRPCYFGTSTSRACNPALWTTERYAQPVIQSMCEAANLLSAEHGALAVELIGYSGGGTIAVGMRACTEHLLSITTIAANLDVRAWTALHRYTPLVLSRHLASWDNESRTVKETHWQCRTDARVPPRITDAYFAAHPDATRIIVDDCSHERGWERYHSRILTRNR
jgi:hypothetical protein